MKFIEFDKTKCDNCYKCLRVCPTKAISFTKENRYIINELCIKCGLCEISCPREALRISSQVTKVLNEIKSNHRVVVSIAPSYVGAFGLTEPNKMVAALKAIGFDYVEETAFGAEIVASHYDQVIEESGKSSVITSCCPSANYLIEQHYPSLIDCVIPVVSPMVAHGRSIKARYGAETKVVFIGPCLAKMAEAEEMTGAVDYVLTFEELDHLIHRTNRDLNDYEATAFDVSTSNRGKAFPIGGSLRNKSNKLREDNGYRYIHVDGIDSCNEVLRELSQGSLDHCYVEMNICEGSCINGPDMPKNDLGRFARETFVRKYAQSPSKVQIPVEAAGDISISRTFVDKQIKLMDPSAMIVKKIMAKTGKYTKEDELNCGACGYQTCYDKAKAVHFGYSDIETCLPFLQAKAESMQNIMIENSPNAVLVIDKELNIREVNPSFVNMFNEENLPMIGMPIELFIQHDLFEQVYKLRSNIYNQKMDILEENKHYLINVVYLEESEMLLVFITDISLEEKRRKEFKRVKEETLLKTQEVIDKQMRVAQEIASLLGETTAETKMSLKSLNELVLTDQGGIGDV